MPGLLRPLAVRDFRLLWAGQAVSLLGDGVLGVALAWQTLVVAHRPTALGLVLVARALPRTLLLLVGGVVSDRLPRRLMLLADLAQGVALAVLAVLTASGRLALWHLVAAAAVAGSASAFFFPASTALLPQLVPGELLLPANSLATTSRLLLAELAGPALGGLLVATVGSALAFALDAASFGVSVATLAALRSAAARPAAPARGLGAELREGLAYARSQAWIWVTLVLAGGANFFAGGILPPLLPLLARDRLRAGAGGLGLLLAAFGAGGGLAVALAGQRGVPRRRVATMYASWAAGGLLVASLALVGRLLAAVAVMLALGCLFELGNLIWTTLLQERVRADVLGRVSSLDWFLSLSLMPVSLAVAAPAAAALGTGVVLAIGGLASTALVAAGLLVPGALAPDRDPT